MFFFFFKQKTAYEMRISDWSSDVCSSDLNKIERVLGTGRIASQGKVAVTGEGGERILEAKNIIIATGSEVTPLAGVEVDEKRIVSSTGALELQKVPKHLIVIGGGYIGLEMGMVWRRLGAAVTVVEYLDSILPNMDAEVAKIDRKSTRLNSSH